MYTLHQFKKLATDFQVDELTRRGIALDLAYITYISEAVLFAYHDFYVEVVIDLKTEEILATKSFKSLKKLDPFLKQIDISEVTILLSCG